jgi:hypothetical protein
MTIKYIPTFFEYFVVFIEFKEEEPCRFVCAVVFCIFLITASSIHFWFIELPQNEFSHIIDSDEKKVNG